MPTHVLQSEPSLVSEMANITAETKSGVSPPRRRTRSALAGARSPAKSR